MNLDPNILRAAYRYLQTTLPFRRWKLPDADAIQWHVTKDKAVTADCYIITGTNEYIIRISSFFVGRTETLMIAMAHEIVHLYLYLRGVKRWEQHGKEFDRLANQVIKHHGWDRKVF